MNRKNMVLFVALVAMVLGMGSGCSTAKVITPESIAPTARPETPAPATQAAMRDAYFKVYEVHGLVSDDPEGDQFVSNVVAVTWIGYDLKSDIPQAEFKSYLIVEVRPDGCTQPQRLELGPGWGVALYGKDSDFGNLPQEGERTTVLWTYCVGGDNFQPPLIESSKTGFQTLLPPLFHPDGGGS